MAFFRWGTVALLLSAAPIATCFQDAPRSFEVAAIKVNTSGSNAGNGFSPTPGRLRVMNSTFTQMIHAAYHVKTGMLFGATGWMESERYDIDAKAPGNSKFDEDMVMLQQLLVDRFQLKFHRETREIKMLALVAAKGGLKIQQSKDQQEKEHITVRPGEISGTAIPLGHFLTILEVQLDCPIQNETGLRGNYDLSLKYSPADTSVYEAMAEQLGLKLETRKGSAEVMVIDSAQKPGEN